MIIFSVSLTGCSNNSEEKLNEKAVSEIEYFNSKLIGVLNKLNNITFENYKMTTKKTELNAQSSEEEKSSSSGSSQNSDEGSSGGGSQEGSGGSSGGSSGDGSSNGGEKSNSIITSQMAPNTILNPQTTEIDWSGIKNEMENLYFAWNTAILDLYKLNVNNNDILAFSNGLDTATNYIKNEDKENALLATASLYGQLPGFLEIVSNDTIKKNIIQTKSYVLNAYALVRSKFMGRCSNRNCKG